MTDAANTPEADPANSSEADPANSSEADPANSSEADAANASDMADADPAISSVEEAADLIDRVGDNVAEVIVGKRDVVDHILGALLADGHVLLEDVPGVGKTMLAKSIARSFDCSFRRVQFTPDLLPSDVTGVNVYNRRTEEFDFQPGPVFANIVLGDEINRAPPKTQSAMLEAMEERQVTTDGETRRLPDPFCVIATQNDVEPGRTYDLPIAEIDRFSKKLRLGYPDVADETDLLDRVADGHPVDAIEPVATAADLRRARDLVESVEATRPVRSYVTRLAAYTRDHAALGVSPRGTIALFRAARARAVMNGRDYLLPDDVQAEAQAVLAHRIRPESTARTPAAIVEDALDTVDADDA
ncbi:MAG: AAA family ATPase [Halobacteriales archaeon]